MKPDLSCIAAIAFDLDGTLVDSAPDIGHALNTALADGGLSCFDLATVRTWIGDGPDALIARALAAQDVSPDDAGLRQRLRRGFDEATLAAPLDNGCVYPGIADLLDSLHGVLPMAVVTNKPTRLAQAVLEAAGLSHHLMHVQGADTPAQRKPAPSMLLSTAARFGLQPSRMLMVGDAPPDMLAAQAAGCLAALVGWGYGAHAVPSASRPWRVETPQKLGSSLLAMAHPSRPSPTVSID
ncbi:MAG TPA: HAD-IA family hydrolase [Burkholderiaceae bacterium]|nr:HAD-IA family hydrolase [Burkholderiaceae bacterium]